MTLGLATHPLAPIFGEEFPTGKDEDLGTWPDLSDLKLSQTATFTSNTSYEKAGQFELEEANIRVSFIQPLSGAETDTGVSKSADPPITITLRNAKGDDIGKVLLKNLDSNGQQDFLEHIFSMNVEESESASDKIVNGCLDGYVLKQLLNQAVGRGAHIESDLGDTVERIILAYGESLYPRPVPKPKESEIKVVELEPNAGKIIGAPEADFTNPKNGNVRWIDIESPTKDVMRSLQKEFGLNPHAVRDCMRFDRHTDVIRAKDHLFFSAHQFDLPNDGERRLSTREVHVFVGRDYLITVHDKPMSTLRNIHKELEAGTLSMFGEGAEALSYCLIDTLIHENKKVYSKIEDEVERLYDELQKETLSSEALVKSLPRLTQSVQSMRRSFADELEIPKVIAAFINGGGSHEGEFTAARLKDLYRGCIGDVEHIHVQLNDVKKINESVVSRQANEIMKKLTIASAVALPIIVFDAIANLNPVSVAVAIGISSVLLLRAKMKNWM